MNGLREFFSGLDYSILIVAVAALCSIIFHEVCHGLAAHWLGDDTAKASGRLSLNPLKHIDVIGLVMLIVFRFGWAKPVPIDMRRFRRPKLGMAITALAGPVSNLLLSFVALILTSVSLIFIDTGTGYWCYQLFYYIAVISLGLGMFNIIPIPPLDGSKILFSLLPDRVYMKLMRYERWGFLLLLALLYFGAFDGFLGASRDWLLEKMWSVANFPLRIYYGV